jgi:Mrp family chromosome partitioning ATPase
LTSSPEYERPTWGEAQSEGALGGYARALRSHRLLVVAVTLAVVAGSVAWLAIRTPEYRATAQLLVNPLPQDDEAFLGLPVIRDSGDPTRTIQTAATLLHSHDGAALAAERLGGGLTAQELLDMVEVQAEGQSNIVAVTAGAAGAERAALIANTFATATLDQRDAALRRELAPIVERLEAAGSRLDRTDVAAVAELEGRLAQLESVRRHGDPTTALSGRATAPASPEGAPAWLIMALAILAGLVLASGAALLTELLSPGRLRDEDELAALQSTPVLARVPEYPRKWVRRRRASPLLAPPSALAGFRGLQLQLAVDDGPHQTILVTSASSKDGKTTSVVNFALELAAAEQRVVLFDVDLRKPELAPALGVAASTDLRAALAPGGSLEDALVPVEGLPTVSVVPGIADARLSTLSQIAGRLPELIGEARSMAAYVLIDTAALGEVGDALPLVAAVDDVLLVARLDHTRLASLDVVHELLRRARKPAIGYVLVGGGTRGGRGTYGRAQRVVAPASSRH